MKTGFSQMKCGLLGEHLSHSFSPMIHNMLSDYEYKLYEVAPANLESFVKDGSVDAFNVTIPYKKAVIPFIDEMSPEATKIGAVNVVVRRNGKIYGYNTDYFGFAYMLDSANISVNGKKVLLLGNGGAAATIKTVLHDRGVGEIAIIDADNNTPENIALQADAKVIINATPVGMYPNNYSSIIDLSLFQSCEAVLDIVYNPARTCLILKAEKRGIVAVGGLSMLVAQAAKGFELFTGESYDDGVIEEIVNRICRETQNIVLIGMPSCGKSTIAELLSKKLGFPFIDADVKFTNMHGITPGDAINLLGEPTFRNMETDALADLGKLSGAIIATGGGAVTREKNYPLLHQNGVIIYIKRDIDKLSTEGRPLSQKGSLNALYERRKPLYEQFADITVTNDGTLDKVAEEIINALKAYPYTCVYNFSNS